MTAPKVPDYTVNLETYEFRKKLGLLLYFGTEIMSGAIQFAMNPPDADDKIRKNLLEQLFVKTKQMVDVQRVYMFDNHKKVDGEDKIRFNAYLEMLQEICQHWQIWQHELSKLPSRFLGKEFAPNGAHVPFISSKETVKGMSNG